MGDDDNAARRDAGAREPARDSEAGPGRPPVTPVAAAGRAALRCLQELLEHTTTFRYPPNGVIVSTDPRHWIAVLRASHANLEEAVAALGPDSAADQSYCRDWSVAQVLSHLGSGAEISLLTLRAAIGEGEPVGPDGFPP